jgi:NADPH:quinone reductase-like Zn-dependent oxidoreductase
MKAIVRDTYGPPDVLELRDIDRPEIGDDEVLLHVYAAGVGRDVWHVMTGLPYPIRLAGYGLRAPKNPVIGSDVAGVVEAVGKNVTRFQPGDEVFGIGMGSYAEYVCAREDKLAHKPANLTFEQAAVVAIYGLTALQALRDHGKVRSGQEVLVIGASGGVGTYAVQIAKAFGAQVTGVCSTTKVEMVRSIGADHVIDYTREDFAEGEQRYDLILDIGGNSSLSRLRRALTSRGQKLGTFISKENHEDMIALKELIESGKVTPVIDRRYPLAEVPEAIRYLQEGHARGKVVITVPGEGA